MRKPFVYAGVLLTSLSVLMLELALTRLFSATMYYHFAFLAISLALFGSAASGVAIYAAQDRLDERHTSRWLALFGLAFAASIVLALVTILNNPVPLEVGGKTYARLAAIYGATAVAFFCGGAVISLAIFRFASDIATLYLFDLAGAAGGCILLIPVLDRVGAVDTVLLVALAAGLAALVFACADRNPGTRRVAVGGVVVLVALFGFNRATGTIGLREAKGQDQSRVAFSKWNSFSRVTVTGELTEPTVQIQIDAGASTQMIRHAGDAHMHQMAIQDITALAYNLKPEADVLIIGPGGGIDVLIARVARAEHITAVEVNPIIVRDIVTREPFLSYTDQLFAKPEVDLVVDEGRSFIRGSSHRYDVIQATMVDTWAATAAGAFALTENNLYTVEAFEDYYDHLADDGLLSMTRWYFEPPDQMLRVLSLLRQTMLEREVSDPDEHVMVVLRASRNNPRVAGTVLFKRSPFTPAEVGKIESLARARRYEVLYTPNTRPDNLFTEMMEAQDPADVWSTFETNIWPTRDNNPFFFNSLRWSDLSRALRGNEEWRKTNLGTLVLFTLLGITIVMVAAFIVGPLLITSRRTLGESRRGAFGHLGYFACLGLGFILVEIVLIQKFILFLGHPVYALAVVLFSILIFSALGSYLSGRFAAPALGRTLRLLLLVIVGLVIVYVAALGPILYALVHLPLGVRIAITVVLVAPLAVMMGMPMPTGIRMLHARLPRLLPWAWAVNGATSVMGSVATLVIAILSGFNQTLLVGSAAYLCALLFVPRD